MGSPRAWVFGVMAFLAGAAAEARTVRDEPYAYETTWNAAIRMVRVDFGYAITERDLETGFFTFAYRENGRTIPASVELLHAEVDGRPGARVILQIPSMPAYVESMMLARLGRKLRTEFGEPPPPPARPAPPAAPSEPPSGSESPRDPAPNPAPPSGSDAPREPTSPSLPRRSEERAPAMRPEGPSVS